MPSPYQASLSASASFRHSATTWAPVGRAGIRHVRAERTQEGKGLEQDRSLRPGPGLGDGEAPPHERDRLLPGGPPMAMSAPVRTPAWHSPLESRSDRRAKASIASATKPSLQARRAPSIWCLAAMAAGLALTDQAGQGRGPCGVGEERPGSAAADRCGSQSSAELVQSSRNSPSTVRTVETTPSPIGCPPSA